MMRQLLCRWCGRDLVPFRLRGALVVHPCRRLGCRAWAWIAEKLGDRGGPLEFGAEIDEGAPDQ